jgi:hypothetical protein
MRGQTNEPLTTRQVAEIAGWIEATLGTKRCRRTGSSFVKLTPDPGGAVRCPRGASESFLASRLVTSEGAAA